MQPFLSLAHLTNIITPTLNEADIISQCKKGKASEQKKLFQKYAPSMIAVCIRFVRNDTDAEELMLKGFYQFFKHIERFEYTGEGSISAFLRKIMINESLMFLRKQKSFQLISDLSDHQAITNESALDKISANEIFQYIAQLPEGYRTVFNLFVIENWTHKEIAKSLQISEGTSKSQLNKARALLQQTIIKNESYGKGRLG